MTSSDRVGRHARCPRSRRIDRQGARRTREDLIALRRRAGRAWRKPRRAHERLCYRRLVGHRRRAGATLRRARRSTRVVRTPRRCAGDGRGDARPGVPALYVGDVRDADALRAAAADFIARHGPADIVIANAGISRGTLDRIRRGQRRVSRHRSKSTCSACCIRCRRFCRPCALRAKGKLVGIASVAGFRGLPGAGAYSASKAAAINYLESLRVELAGSGVEVITICPGYVATPMTAGNPYRMPFLLSRRSAPRP